MRYKKSDNALYVYADDVVPRHVTTALPLDYDTVAGADKFGNFFITRLPASVSVQVRPSHFHRRVQRKRCALPSKQTF